MNTPKPTPTALDRSVTDLILQRQTVLDRHECAGGSCSVLVAAPGVLHVINHNSPGGRNAQ